MFCRRLHGPDAKAVTAGATGTLLRAQFPQSRLESSRGLAAIDRE